MSVDTAAAIAAEQKVFADTARALVEAAARDEWDGKPRTILFKRLCEPGSFDEWQPANTVKPTYDIVAYLARRCAHAYQSADKIKAIVEGKEGGTDFCPFRAWTDAAFGYRRGKTVVVAFRGTIITSFQQWLFTNLLAFPERRPPRHVGFQLAWERLRPELLEWIERTPPKDGELMLTGHSLGGAIAILAAFELSDDYPVRAVVTIGAPRVGFIGFRDRYLNKPHRPMIKGERAVVLGEVTRRITHADDFVSRVPPGPIFRHVGAEYRLDAKGLLVPGESRGALARMFSALDAAVGWCYRKLDEQRTLPGYVPPRNFGANIKGSALDRILREGKRDKPVNRLFVDTVNMHTRFPFLLMVSYTTLLWVLIGIGALVAFAVFLINLFDLRSHLSDLYVKAFRKRYGHNPAEVASEHRGA